VNRFEVSVVIDRPIARVWEYLNTTENELVWQSSAVERVLVTHGPLDAGSRTHQVDRFLGRRIETEWEVTELEDYYRRDRTLTGPFDMEVEWQLEPVGEFTRFTMTMASPEGRLEEGLFGILTDPIVMRIAKREWEANLGTFKDILEADTA
jgi:hypothetical protein